MECTQCFAGFIKDFETDKSVGKFLIDDGRFIFALYGY